MSYDDGWALGMNMSSNPPMKGVFPRDCVEEGDITGEQDFSDKNDFR
jgi:hypothetical protein